MHDMAHYLLVDPYDAAQPFKVMKIDAHGYVNEVSRADDLEAVLVDAALKEGGPLRIELKIGR